MTISGLTLDQTIGQLFVVPPHPSAAKAELEGQPGKSLDYVMRLIKEKHIGGVLLKHHWELADQIDTVDKLQTLSERNPHT